MKLTYYGQSCFLLETEGKKILFDPFITPNDLAKHIDVDAIEADFILVSHGHEDHTADLVNIASRTGALVVCSYEIMVWLNGKGVTNCHPMNLGGQRNFDFGKVKMVFAAHSNSLPDGTYGGTAAGFILHTSGKTLYYAGDTALMQEMKLTGDMYKLDYAFLPIGDNFTMGIEDAIVASKFIKCNEIIGMHYDTFGYIAIDKKEALTKFDDAGLSLKLIDIGSSIEL
ncbi:metal-dependent hydrolase [Pedobacter sp. SYSU D00535]|uniref:metal-dependent hydrolase n=1 Tax=Pedobacter sp. SYSU D00535 TaxID=2810308 RepID=UPI001A964D7B|nr:metal-dependent hydrolase [Pedobacter sp. SYSU D00535]